MEDLSTAVLSSWALPFWPTLLLLLLATLYVRGWRAASATRQTQLPLWRLLCFLAGLALFWLSIASPLDALGEFLLVAHMTQHLLLMSVVPPLLVLGAPTVPLLRGIPRLWMREVVATWIDFPPLQGIGRFLAHPLVAWMAMNASYAIWHIPVLYELALRSNDWHYFEHACFFLGSFGYWWHVIDPWPSHRRTSRWMVVPYIVSADLVNTAISSSLAFSGHVVYATYATVPRIFAISALDDQVMAGAEMWVLTSLISLLPLMGVVNDLLARKRIATKTPSATTLRQKPALDLLRVPGVGWLLRARYGRLAVQTVSFLLMLVVIAHGLAGTRVGALNLAGGSLWMCLRPLLFLLLLVSANFFCFGCPFLWPREWLRRFYTPRRKWPRWLANKWMALLLMVGFFWFYLEYDVWNWPSAAAWLLMVYTAAALLVDSIFAGASFCKYVCPLGQFNFLTAQWAPLSLSARSQDVCTSCQGRECITGSRVQRGCELQLYMPQKIGNLDCTLCMDCVKACPHQNIQLAPHAPLQEVIEDNWRSSVGRVAQRMDLAALALTFSVYSLWNAAAMTMPVVAAMARLRLRLPLLQSDAAVAVGFLLLLGVCLAALLVYLQVAARASGIHAAKLLVGRFAFALLPLSLSCWAAHLLFHFTTSSGNLLATLDQLLADAGLGHSARLLALLSSAASSKVCAPGMVMLGSGGGQANLMSLQIWILDAGLLVTLYLFWWSLGRLTPEAGRRWRLWGVALLPAVAFYAASVWVFLQPMLMPGAGGQ